MHSGIGKGKVVTNSSNIHILSLSQTNAAEKAGAIKKDTWVRARMANGGAWQIAKILEAQIIPPENQTKNSKFRYYVTYLDENRRLDRWVTDQEVMSDPVKIAEELKMREKQQIKHQGELFENDEHLGMDKKAMQDHEEATKIKTINQLELGGNILDTWYFSPFPREFHTDILYACDFCLNFYLEKEQKERHLQKCKLRHPPGDEIYRDEDVSIFEVDGLLQKIYCENLSLISKLFLDHKTLRYDCSPFRYYVLCEPRLAEGEYSYHIVGYFSKEKGIVENNLSCIMVLPSCQRKGYGKFLIEFSYELSLIEGKPGTPERPLSDLGFRGYLSWWTYRILTLLTEMMSTQQLTNISIQQISERTGIDPNDVLYVLENYKILRTNQSGQYMFLHPDYIDEILKNVGKPLKQVVRGNIHWVPHYVRAPPNNKN